MNRKLLYSLFIGTVLMYSCNKDDEKISDLQPQEAKQTLQTISSESHSDIVEITQSEGVENLQVLADLMALDETPFTGARFDGSFTIEGRVDTRAEMKAVIKKKALEFKRVFSPAKRLKGGRTAEERFVLSESAGVYTWDNAAQMWDADFGGSTVVLNFPSDMENAPTVNNAQLTINGYSDVAFTDDMGYTEYLPTSIDAELKVGGVKYVDLDFTATYNADQLPKTLDANFYIKPFTYTSTFADNGTTVTVTGSIQKDGSSDKLVSTNLTATFKEAAKETLEMLSGFVQYREIKLTGQADAKSLSAIEEPSVADLNTHINIDLVRSSDDAKIGDIEFYEVAEGSDDAPVRIKFVDGTTEKFETYFQSTIDELEDFFTELEE